MHLAWSATVSNGATVIVTNEYGALIGSNLVSAVDSAVGVGMPSPAVKKLPPPLTTTDFMLVPLCAVTGVGVGVVTVPRLLSEALVLLPSRKVAVALKVTTWSLTLEPANFGAATMTGSTTVACGAKT